MTVPLLDLKAQYQHIKPEVEAAVARVFASQRFILGPEVEACEAEVAAYCQAAHGVGVSSGTDALLIALMAEGIGEGDQVITTPYSFFATAGAVARVGATPVFADIDPQTYNLEPANLASKITERTKAIIPVHLFGQCASMDPILELAKQHELIVIEDAAQAIGAEYQGRRAGSMGDYGCFSFFPSKNLGAAGDGGLVTCQDADKAEKLRWFRNHGANPKYHHRFVGGNFRLDALQAAVVRVKLKHLDDWTAARQANAARYRALIDDAGLVQVGTPKRVQARHIFNQYVLRLPAEQRDAVREGLRAAAIGCEVYYPIPLHLQECFAGLGYNAGALPESEAAALSTLAIPVYPELSELQQGEVVGKLRELLT